MFPSRAIWDRFRESDGSDLPAPPREGGRTVRYRLFLATVGLVLLATLSERVGRADARTLKPSDDVAVAVAGTIQPQDAPTTTFTSEYPGSSQLGPNLDKALFAREQKQMSGIPECRAFADANRSQASTKMVAASADTGLDDGTNFISSEVTVFATLAAAKKFYAAVANPSYGACNKKRLTFRLEEPGNRTTAPSITVHTVPAAGDQTIGWRNRDPLLHDTTDEIFVRSGRAIAQYVFSAPSMNASVEEAMVKAASTRLSHTPRPA
jgi:hypothetical protein